MELELEEKLIDILEVNIMGDNSQILKLMRMMNSTPKYWILLPNVVMVGSYDDGYLYLCQKKYLKIKWF